MRFLRALMEELPFAELEPDDGLVSALPSGQPIQALKARDGHCAAVYFAGAGKRTEHLRRLGDRRWRGWWFDPRTGGKSEMTGFEKAGPEWGPPSADDWVLVLRRET